MSRARIREMSPHAEDELELVEGYTIVHREGGMVRLAKPLRDLR